MRKKYFLLLLFLMFVFSHIVVDVRGESQGVEVSYEKDPEIRKLEAVNKSVMEDILSR